MRRALAPDRRTTEQVAAVHALLEAHMCAILADLVRTAPRTPLVCDGCHTPQPAAAMALGGGDLCCPRCAAAASQELTLDRTAAG